VAVSPLPIVAMILVLATPQGRANGSLFGLGWLAGLIVYLVGGQHAARTLDTWKTWAADHNAAVMAVLFVVFGFKLVGDGIAVLF
jgi:threonine/homoserine/homoserine lactone efflux protein